MFCNSFRAAFIVVLVSGAVLAEGQTFTVAQAKHYDKLTHELISPCCFREPIAIHRSEEALQMLDEVRFLVAQGKSEDEIKAMYVKRYGLRVLSDPPGITGDWLYTIPVALLFCLLFLTMKRARCWLVSHAQHPGSSQSPELIARVRMEVGE